MIVFCVIIYIPKGGGRERERERERERLCCAHVCLLVNFSIKRTQLGDCVYWYFILIKRTQLGEELASEGMRTQDQSTEPIFPFFSQTPNTIFVHLKTKGSLSRSFCLLGYTSHCPITDNEKIRTCCNVIELILSVMPLFSSLHFVIF